MGEEESHWGFDCNFLMIGDTEHLFTCCLSCSFVLAFDGQENQLRMTGSPFRQRGNPVMFNENGDAPGDMTSSSTRRPMAAQAGQLPGGGPVGGDLRLDGWHRLSSGRREAGPPSWRRESQAALSCPRWKPCSGQETPERCPVFSVCSLLWAGERKKMVKGEALPLALRRGLRRVPLPGGRVHLRGLPRAHEAHAQPHVAAAHARWSASPVSLWAASPSSWPC